MASRANAPPSVADAARGQIRSGAARALSIAVVLDGSIVASQTFGGADPRDAFSVGSISKMFTAVSILQLVQRGKVALDGDAASYLPHYPALAGITVRQLLNHTSGLPNYADDAVADGTIFTKTTPDAILSDALSKPRNFAPGTDWNYTNTGYVVLGQIVERVSGLSLAQYETVHIFDPVGMKESFVAPPLRNNAVAPFGGDPGNWSWYYGCGDVFSTADDLARFDIALMRGDLLAPKMFGEMQRTSPYPTLAPGMHDGLGLFVSRIGDATVVGHHGGEPGYRADNEMIPDRGFAVAVVGNGSYDTSPMVAQALSTYVETNLRAALPASEYVDGAPAMTARLKALLSDLRNGADDRSQMDVLAAIAVPGIARQLRSDGPITDVRFWNKIYTSTGMLYSYRVTFGASGAVLIALIDPSGKLAMLRMSPVAVFTR